MGVATKGRGEYVFGDVVVLDDLTINDDIFITGDITITGNFAIDGTLTLSDDSTIEGGYSSGGLLTAIRLAPFASTATATITQHRLFGVGDLTGTTAYGFGDVTKRTYGAQFSFGRTAIATDAFSGHDISLVVRAINKLVNNAAYNLEGASIKAKNYTGGTVGDLTGLHIETVNDGTDTTSTVLRLTTDGSTIDYGIDMHESTVGTADILLSNSATIVNTSNTLTIEEATLTMDAGTLFSVESGDIRLGFDNAAYVKIAVTDGSGITAITQAGTGPTLAWTVPEATWTHSTSNFIYTPDFRIGFAADAYMKIAVAETTGITAITHGGGGVAVTWTAPSFDFVGDIALDTTNLDNHDLDNVKHIGLGNGAADDNKGVVYIETLAAMGDNVDRHGVYSSMNGHRTAAVYTGTLHGGSFIGSVGASNTQNWTNATAGLQGVNGQIITETGTAAEKVVTGAASLYADATINAAADDIQVTNYYGLYVAAQTLVANTKLTNDYGIYVASQAGGATVNTGINIDGTSVGLAFTGTVASPINMSAATSTTDITLSNGGTIHNTSNALITVTEAELAMIGKLTVGAGGVGHEVKLHCDTANYNVWLDDDGDGNKGTWYFGDDTYGVDTVFNGQTTASRMTWDASAIQLDFLKGSIEMTGLLATQGLASPYIGIGTSAASIEVSTFGDHVLGMGAWYKLTTNGAYSLLGGYFKVETDGANEVADAQLVAVAPRVTVDMNLDSAYGVQSHMTISGTKTSSELINVSAYTELGAGTRTADRVCALQAMISGSGTAGTVNGDCFVAYIANRGTVITTDAILNVHNQSAATAADAIRMDLNGTVTYAFNFAGTVSDAWTTATAGTSVTPSAEYVLIPVDVVGTANPLYVLAAQTWTAV